MRNRYFIDTPKAAWARALKEHSEMLRLVKSRNGARLAEVIQRHMIGSWHHFEAGYGTTSARTAAPRDRER